MKIRFLFVALLVVLPLTLFAQCDSCGMKDTSACGGSSCGMTASPTDANAPAGDKAKAPADPTLTISALEMLIKSKTPMVLLDARTGANDDGKRIPGAKALAPEATSEQIQAVVPAKDQLVVTYCAGGACKAGPQLAASLRKLGYTNVMEVPDGIKGWLDAGKETELAKK